MSQTPCCKTRVKLVWLLQKKDKGDGFAEFHYDYKNIGGGSNDVSFTVNVNPGKLNGANDIATMIILLSNEEPSVLLRSRRQEMMQKLSLQEKEEINQIPKEDLLRLKCGMMYTKDVNYYMDYLIRSAKQDDNYGASNIVLPCPSS